MSLKSKPFHLGKLLGSIFLGYVLYFLILGPFWAADGRGFLGWVPETMRAALYVPAGPIMLTPARGAFVRYMDLWYVDPNAPDMPTGWDGNYWGPPP